MKGVQVAAFLGTAAAGLVLFVLAPARADGDGPKAIQWIGPHDSQLGCIKCHEREVAAWELSSHGREVDWLDRSALAATILEELGMAGQVPTEVPLCQSCHTTPFDDPFGGPQAIQERSVSCERCHGAAGSWVGVHCDYRDSQGRRLAYGQRAGESSASAARRVARSEAAGMIRSAQVYRIAENCIACHTLDVERAARGVAGGVTSQQLAGTKHPFGSADPSFELVAFSQGEVRHNFLHDGKNQAPHGMTLAERWRTLYVAGLLVDLERGLQRLGACGDDDKTLWKALAKRVRAAQKDLDDVVEALPETSLRQQLAAIAEAVPKYSRVKPKAQEKILTAAIDLSSRVRTLLENPAHLAEIAQASTLAEMLPSEDDLIDRRSHPSEEK